MKFLIQLNLKFWELRISLNIIYLVIPKILFFFERHQNIRMISEGSCDTED